MATLNFTKNKPLVLASSSSRRIEILKREKIDFITRPTDINESIPEKACYKEAAMYLALTKGLACEINCQKGLTIVAADTLVYLDRIFGKPQSKKEALETLLFLSGKTHLVITGVALINAGSHERKVFYEETEISFVNLDRTELELYLKTDEAYDKAGAYAIQGHFKKYVSNIKGDLDNVVGFPWERIKEEIISSYN